MVSETFGVLANLRLKIEDPLLPLLCPGAELSSDVDHQNSVSSKSSSGQHRMSNG
jgi:hypothetical protein